MTAIKKHRRFTTFLLSLALVESFTIDSRQCMTIERSALQASTSNYHHNNYIQHNGNNKSNTGVNENGTVMPNVRLLKTAMDSAVLAEWEPVSELERRIEDGILYEHWPVTRTKAKVSNQKSAAIGEESMYLNKISGVFCGLKVTTEEYTRLKSADPRDTL